MANNFKTFKIRTLTQNHAMTKRPMAWVPEPMRWIGVRLTQLALIKADNNNGKRGLWLKLLDALNLGFTC